MCWCWTLSASDMQTIDLGKCFDIFSIRDLVIYFQCFYHQLPEQHFGEHKLKWWAQGNPCGDWEAHGRLLRETYSIFTLTLPLAESNRWCHPSLTSQQEEIGQCGRRSRTMAEGEEVIGSYSLGTGKQHLNIAGRGTSYSRGLRICGKHPKYGKNPLFMSSSHTSTKNYQIKLVGIILSKSKCCEALLETFTRILWHYFRKQIFKLNN